MLKLSKEINLICIHKYNDYKKEIVELLSHQKTSPTNFSDFLSLSVLNDKIKLQSTNSNRISLVPTASIIPGKNENEVKVIISFGITLFILLTSVILYSLIMLLFNNDYKFEYSELVFVMLVVAFIFTLRINLVYCIDHVKYLESVCSNIKEVKTIKSINSWKIEFQPFDGKYL